jgi:hypothetical protein
MNLNNEKTQVLNLTKQGLSSRAIAQKLGISKSKAHNIIRDNRMSTTQKGQEQNTSIMPNFSPQNTSIMSINQQNSMSTTSINTQNSVSILSKVPKNVAFLAENLVSPAHIQLTEQERYDETMFFVSVANYHLESKRIYKEFIDTIDYLLYNSVLSFEEVDEYILKLKTIARDTDKLVRAASSGGNSDIFRLPFLYSNSLVKNFYSMKMNCKVEGEQFCEIGEGTKELMKEWLSYFTNIHKAFPLTYDSDCEQIENNFQMFE